MKKNSLSLLNRVDARLAACAAVAAAGTALTTTPAQADIVSSGMVNINVPSTTSGIYINFVTGVFATSPGGAPGWDLNPWSGSSNNFWANNSASPMDGVLNNFPGGTSATLVDNLALGTLVNGTYTFGRTNSSETTGATAFNLSSTNNYIGIQFLNEATGQLNYGWAQFQLGATPGAQPRTLIQFAYENMGAPIAVGAVPEPSTFALLGVMALGGLGVRAWRARKAA